MQQLAADVVERALRAGATEAEVVIREGDEFSTLVRLGQVETLKESGARGYWSARVSGVERSRIAPPTPPPATSPRPGWPTWSAARSIWPRSPHRIPLPACPSRSHGPVLPAISTFTTTTFIPCRLRSASSMPRRAEAAALSADPRLKKSDGGSFDAATGHKVMANSRGFVGEYRRSYCSLSAMPIAETEQGGMQRDYWFSSARTLARLDSPESIGAEAARRTLRRLNARRVATQRVPIVFAPEIARSLIGNIFEAANGDSIYRGASFWANQLGQQVASFKCNRH